MFKICRHQLIQAVLSPRFYIALLVGITVQSLSVTPLLEFAQKIGEPVSIVDGFLLLNMDIFSLAAASLGIYILVSDIPFTSQNETYTLLRITRTKWVAGKVLYLLCICTIYYVIVFLSGAVLLGASTYCADIWSQPLYLLATGSGTLQAEVGLSFPGYILSAFSPFQSALLCFVYCVSYGFVLSMVTFWLNMKLHTVIGYFFAVMFHVLNYFTAAIIPWKPLRKYSLLANSVLSRHKYELNIQGENLLTNQQSFILFVAVVLVVAALIYFAVKKYDFKITVGTKQ